MYSYLDHYERTINNQKFLCFRVLYDDFEKHIHTIVSIYKPFTNELLDKAQDFEAFDDISNKIGFKVKGDGKCHITFEI